MTGCEEQKKAPAPPPPLVEVLTVQPQAAPIDQTWVATVKGYINADIRAQVSGYLQSQDYRNGAYVKAGDVLFQIDPRPFQAALDQAKGSLSQAQAQNTANELNAQRSTELYQKKVISQQQYDDQMQQYAASKANVATAQAAVEQAQLNLTFTKITAPVTGLASIATAQVGDLVSPSSGTLATVIQVDPIKVSFMVPEQGYINFIQQYFNDPSKSPIGNPSYSGPGFPITLTLASGVAYEKDGKPVLGKLTSVNNVVGIDTGSIAVEGVFPNPGNLLRPGQFGLVTATVRVEENCMVIPQRAVINLQGINQLALVGADNKVNIVQVKLGPTTGSDQIVTEGLKAGDRVVIEGTQKVKQGAVVNPQPYTESKAEVKSDATPPPTPTPAPAKD
jgi:membrane fusion protein (multidrug efflux system)